MASQFPYTPPAQPIAPPPMLGLQPPTTGAPSNGVSVGGILPILSQREVEARERAAAELTQQKPVIQSLAAHVRKCFDEARTARQSKVEERMFRNLRARRGEYDPEILSQIRQQGGSEIYMMITSVKCRGASSWLRDVMGGKGDSKPWTLRPTPIAALPFDTVEEVRQKAIAMVQQSLMATGAPPSKLEMQKLLSALREEALNDMQELAQSKVALMERKMEDQLVEGGLTQALDDFIDDLMTFPAAVLKGPVVRKRTKMAWDTSTATPELKLEEKLVPEWERVDPFMCYPSPASSGIDDGYFIERHKLRRGDLESFIGVEGFDEQAIRAVLDEHGTGGLQDWLTSDSSKAAAEGKDTAALMANTEGLIDALQFWGSVSGKMLREWGMTSQEVPDQAKEYPCEVWLIGRWVVKAVLNHHPLGKKPYYKASYEDIPGSFWGNAVADLVRDCQLMCNSAARALANNMGIASGPQVAINNSRLPTGEDVTQMYPWKIWQFVSDPLGGSEKPIEFFQPETNAQQLMAVFEKFSVLADEYSGIPRYMTGDSPTGGAGRTASGFSMLMNNAAKTMKQVVSSVDVNVFTPLLEQLYFFNMKYSQDPGLIGDVQIVALGATGVLAKESAQVRRNEFLVATANPVDLQIIGMQGRAALLRKTAESLDIDPNDVVPSPDKMRFMNRIAAAQQPMQQPMQQQPSPTNNKQELQDGAPVTDNFSPSKAA